MSSPRDVSCYKLDADNDLVFFKRVTTAFELTTGSNPYILCIIENTLFIGKGTDLLARPLQGSVGSSNFTLPSSLVDASEVYGNLYLLLQKAGGSGSYAIMQWDNTKDIWSSPTENNFVGNDGLFNKATSNVILHLDSWGQVYAIYGQEKQLIVNQLSFGPVFPIAATQCNKITKVSSSANGRGVLVHCGNNFFVYSMEDAVWMRGTERWGVEYEMEHVKELASPHVFAVPTFTNPNSSLPGTIAFLTLDGQRVTVSLRAGTLTGAAFTQSGYLFCYSENGISGVLCHNASVMISGGVSGSASSYLYATQDGATIVSSIGSKVVVEYVDDTTGDTKLEVLPKQSKEDEHKVEIDRKSLCDEIKESVPSLFKLFCGNRK